MAEKKEIEFSRSQIDAIDASDKTLVVSAGAGSGKTTVLTERILRRLIAGTDITEILVVTFLRSAALSLRTHLYDALTAYAVSHPQDAHITRSIYMLPAARISTVDSFCLDIVRDNFNALSLPPALRVIDGCENEILTENCVDRLIDAKLASEDEDFLALCGNFAERHVIKYGRFINLLLMLRQKVTIKIIEECLFKNLLHPLTLLTFRLRLASFRAIIQ